MLTKFAEVNLTVNLAKSKFGHAEVTLLCHVIGSGWVKPLGIKIQSILEYPPPSNKRELMRFLGTVGYYQRLCQNFSVITAPLTNLLKKGQEYVWSTSCQDVFIKVKSVLMSTPGMLTPNFQRKFMLMVDASGVGAGAVLMQFESSGIEHPICYFSRKFN